MKGKADLKRRVLFDGIGDDQFYQKIYSIEHNRNYFKFSVLDFKSLRYLKTEISEKDFNEILKTYDIIVTLTQHRFSLIASKIVFR